jgi:hypothetical protein
VRVTALSENGAASTTFEIIIEENVEHSMSASFRARSWFEVTEVSSGIPRSFSKNQSWSSSSSFSRLTFPTGPLLSGCRRKSEDCATEQA